MENSNNLDTNIKDSKQLAKEAREWVGFEEGQKAIAEAHAQAKLAEAKAVTDELDNIQKMNRMRGDLEYWGYWAGFVSLG
ncbi:MAG: hypothetical protein MUF43_06710 [Flavobacterium sp.]|jgi:hypothetical protein|nr:hypothetical protein [Flavobacterium sp.]